MHKPIAPHRDTTTHAPSPSSLEHTLAGRLHTRTQLHAPLDVHAHKNTTVKISVRCSFVRQRRCEHGRRHRWQHFAAIRHSGNSAHGVPSARYAVALSALHFVKALLPVVFVQPVHVGGVRVEGCGLGRDVEGGAEAPREAQL